MRSNIVTNATTEKSPRSPRLPGPLWNRRFPIRAALAACALGFCTVGPWVSAQVPAPDVWRLVSPTGSGMRVLMPGEPKLTAPTIKPLPDHEVVVHLAMVTQNQGKSLYLVGYHDLDALPTDEQKKNDVLEGGVKGTVLNTLGKLTKHEPITLGENPGRAFEYSGDRFGQQVRGVSRIYLVGGRVYQLTVLSTPEVEIASDAEKFFKSFELLPSSPPAAGQ